MNSESELKKAKLAYQRGDRPAARSILASMVKNDPSNSQAWYLLSFMVDKTEQVVHGLNQAIKFDPMNRQIRERLAQFQTPNDLVPPVQIQQQVRHYQPVQSVRQATKQKEWYRESLFKIFTFLFLMPVWVFIMLTDPDESSLNKVGAVAFQLFLCMAACLFLIWGSG